MKKYDIQNCPLIFPKLVALLCSKGFTIKIEGENGADFKMSQSLMKYRLTEDMTSLPDFAYYNRKEKRWFEVNIEEDAVVLNQGRYGYLFYSKKMLELNRMADLHILKDWVRLNSACKIHFDDIESTLISESSRA